MMNASKSKTKKDRKRGPKAIAVTLNPSLDRTLVTRNLGVGYHNLSDQPSRLDAAGKGMNIARAINNLGIYTVGIVMLGKDISGRTYHDLIQDRGYETQVVWVDGHTRSNTIILDVSESTETQISEQGVEVTQTHLDEVGTRLSDTIAPGDSVILAGSLPHGASVDAFAHLTRIANQAGGKVSLMLSGEELARGLAADPNMVVATQLQMEAYFNYPVRTPRDVLGCAQRLSEKGSCRVLLEMSDERQLVFATTKEAWLVTLPDANYEDESTTSGILEAAVAGFLASRMSGETKKKALIAAAAAATFSSTQIGNVFGSLKQLQKFSREAEIAPAEKVIKPSILPDHE